MDSIIVVMYWFHHCQQKGASGDQRAGRAIPKVIFLDAPYGPQFTNFGTSTEYLDANMSSYFDSGIIVVGELRWCGVGLPFDIVGNQLCWGFVNLTLCDCRRDPY